MANTAWAFANLYVMNRPLLDAISSAARRMLTALCVSAYRRVDLLALTFGLLGIGWAHAFLEVESTELGASLQCALGHIGAEVDRLDRLRVAEWTLVPELEPHATRGITSREPHLALDLRGLVVIHKEPDWEVDGKHRARREEGDGFRCPADGGGEPPALSAWLRATLPRSRCPATRDASLDFGFLHRLDVPSSGLVLCGTTFAGLVSLRWQLDTYRVERQYGVYGHGLAPPEGLRVVVANIDPRTIDSRRSFVAEARGKPARSWFTVPAHVGGGACGALSCSALAVRIRTGRRHQIRAHMLHVGHPTVVDAKYAARTLTFYRLASYERGYILAGCPD